MKTMKKTNSEVVEYRYRYKGLDNLILVGSNTLLMCSIKNNFPSRQQGPFVIC